MPREARADVRSVETLEETREVRFVHSDAVVPAAGDDHGSVGCALGDEREGGRRDLARGSRSRRGSERRHAACAGRIARGIDVLGLEA